MVRVLGGEEAFIGALEGNFGQPDNRDERENVPRERKVQMHREAVGILKTNFTCTTKSF